MNNAWVITQNEFQQNEIQFITLKPIDGMLNGDQAKSFMLRSGLPPNVLAQVWHLSDINKDGRLDKLEFAISVKLIRNALSGLPLPNVLPDSMKQIQASQPQPYVRPPAFGAPQMPMPLHQPQYNPQFQPPPQPQFVMGTKETGDWNIPHGTKLKYSQKFNQLDRDRKDYLTGQQARGIMGESQLPTPILGQIWNLSDPNKEGYLSIEKFCVAMFLIDRVKEGYALPKTLPPELQTFIIRSKAESPVVSPGEEPPQKTPVLKTFEDKRRDNLDKGEAELERRRQVLREEEDRRRMEIERREREEAEKREAEWREQEAKRQAELEVQRQRDKELQEQREAEEAKLRAEREEARKKAEEERMKLLVDRHIKDLEIQLQAENEKTAQIQQRHKTMTFQLQGLEEKLQQCTLDNNEARNEVCGFTEEIEGMRAKRDEKVGKIQDLTNRNQQTAVQCERVSHQNLQLQTECQKVLGGTKEIEHIRNVIVTRNDQIKNSENQIEETKQRLEVQKKLVSDKKPEFEVGEEKIKKLMEKYNALLAKFVARQQELHQKVKEKRLKNQPQQVNNTFNPFPKQNDLYEAPPDAQNAFATAFEDHFAPQSQVTQPTESGNQSHALPKTNDNDTVKYRALYEFVARSEDELSLQPGDVVQVFENHTHEPGWLAGRIKQKIGWFPASYVEPVAKQQAPPAQNSPTSPSVEVLASIKEEPAEKDFNADFGAHFPVNDAPVGLYDAPPGDIESPVKAAPVAAAPSTASSDTVISVGTAQFPWKARYDSELSFAKGETIEILEKTEMRWRGRVQGKPDTTGWFPKSYVKLNENSPVPVDLASPTTSVPKSISHHSIPASTPVGIPHSPSGEWYVALYPFVAVESNDLELKFGDRIWVTETNGEWWKGSANNKTGIFPSNYVQKESEANLNAQSPLAETAPAKTEEKAKVIAAFEATEGNQMSLHVGEIVTVREKVQDGWWEGEVERDGAKVSGWFPTNYVQLLNAAHSTSGSVLADAAFDYDAQQADELSFKAGDVIVITEKEGTEWWKGHKQSDPNGTSLLFPSNFVQLRDVFCTVPTVPIKMAKPKSERLQNIIKELIDTEHRFGEDLMLVRQVFMKPMALVLSEGDLDKLFLNWNELIKLSKKIHMGLMKKSPGEVFCKRIDALDEYVKFCEQQQNAIDFLNKLDKTNSAFQKCHAKCQQNENVRGVTLSYYLLLPMARITRYPLIFEKILKETDKDDDDYEHLHSALQLLQSLCARVNNAISDVENKGILCWSQQHIVGHKLDLEFTSDTREIGPRKFLQSGIVHKLKNNKLLVIMLYNDMIILSTPNENISDPSNFKITKYEEINLNLYKTPMILNDITVEDIASQPTAFQLKNNKITIQLKAKNSNEKTFWINNIQKAVDEYDVQKQLKEAKDYVHPSAVCPDNQDAGKVSVEVQSLSRTDFITKTINVYLQLDEMNMPLHSVVELNNSGSVYTTNLHLRTIKQSIRMQFKIQQEYRPDMLIGEFKEDLLNLVRIGAHHRGPIIRKLHLENSDIGKPCDAVVKFVFTLKE